MLVLGSTSDEKGTQLEQLTKDILADLGYRDITTNRIDAGGEEIDVAGKHEV